MFTEIFHNVGNFIKYLGASLIFILSISLSFAMFSSISPPDMPWFPWAALGLTDGGFLGWLVVFRMIKYHGAHKSVAFVMIWVCLAAALFTDAMELAHMFHIAPLFAGMYYYALIALLLAHFLALAIDELISEGQKYNEQHGLSPSPQYRVTEERSQRPQPKESERTLEQRSTRQLPPARSTGPGIWQSFTSLFRRPEPEAPVAALPPAVPNSSEADEEARIRQEIRQEREEQERQQRLAAIRSRIIAEEQQQPATETSVQQPEPVDRKAEAEQQSKK